MLGRERNKVKFNIWGFYIQGGGKEAQSTNGVGNIFINIL